MNGQRDVFAEMKERERVALLQEADQKRKEQDTYNVMHTEEGRRFVYQILKACGVYAPSFNTNALTMAFKKENAPLAWRSSSNCANRATNFIQLC